MYVQINSQYKGLQNVPLFHLPSQIEALVVEGDPSEEQQQVLNGLQDRINQAIELYGEEGALVRIGGRLVAKLCTQLKLLFVVTSFHAFRRQMGCVPIPAWL